MLKIFGIIVLFILVAFLLRVNSKELSKVYFTKDISGEGVLDLFQKIGSKVNGKVAIKVHFGEDGNINYLKPDLIKELTLKLNATLVETNVLYRGKRRFTEDHLKLARKHGFDFAPIDILNSEGEKELAVNLKHFKTISVGSHLDDYDHLIIFSHFKGHIMAGFGGAIKNVAMGLSSIPGKMAMHASSIPLFNNSRCTSCKLCLDVCTVDAITLDPLVIDTDKCIGCGKCIGICPARAIQVPWGSTPNNEFNERMVEYVKGISENYNMIYINVLANISKNCDCDAYAQKPFMDDIGILASTDIVAIEKASLDLVNEAHNCKDTFLKVNSTSGNGQIDYAHELGLGNIKYELIELK